MLDSTKLPNTAATEPNIRSPIGEVVAEMGNLIASVKTADYIDDGVLDELAWRGDALLDQIAAHRALSLDDALLKLELWRRLPTDLWSAGRIIDSVVMDLQELGQQSHSQR